MTKKITWAVMLAVAFMVTGCNRWEPSYKEDMRGKMFVVLSFSMPVGSAVSLSECVVDKLERKYSQSEMIVADNGPAGVAIGAQFTRECMCDSTDPFLVRNRKGCY